MGYKQRAYLTRGVTTCLVWILLIWFATATTYYVEQNKIVSKIEFPSNCTDSAGVQRSDLDTWTTSPGSCDLRVCHAGLGESRRWQINHDCPPQIEFLDTVNCRYEGNSSLTFPNCCPVLRCDEREVVNTTNSTGCVDLSPAASCQFWKDIANCTHSIDGFLQRIYNFTIEFCMETCGLCP